MKVACPQCGAHIPVESISLEGGWVRCPSCEWRDALTSILPEVPPEDTVEPQAPPAPTDTSILMERPLPGEVTFYIPSKRSGFWLFFAIFWNAFLVLFTVGVAVAGDLFLLLFTAPFWAAGLGFLVAALFSTHGRTLVHVDGRELAVKRELFGYGRLRRFALSPKASAKLAVAYEQNEVPVYVCAVSTKSKEVKFGSFLSDEEKSWLVAVINDVLGQAFPHQRPAPGTAPSDTKIVVHHVGPDHVEFEIPSRPHKHLVLFSVIWWVVVCPVVTLMAHRVEGLERWLFPAVFWLFGIVAFFAVMWSLFGRTQLSIEGRRLTVRKAVFGVPLVGRYTLAETSMAHLLAYSKEQAGTREGCSVGITTREGEARFGLFLSQREQALLTGALNDVLQGALSGSLACPKCRRLLADAQVSERLGIAKCPDCDEVFRTSELLRAEREEIASVEAAEGLPDNKVRVEDLGSQLQVTFPAMVYTVWGKMGLAGTVLAGAGWFLGLAAFAKGPVQAFRAGDIVTVFSWFLGAVAVGAAMKALATQQALTFSGGRVVRTWRLFLFRWQKEFHALAGERVTLPQPAAQHLPTGMLPIVNDQASLQLRCAEETLEFGSRLSVEERRRLCRRINQFLDGRGAGILEGEPKT